MSSDKAARLARVAYARDTWERPVKDLLERRGHGVDFGPDIPARNREEGDLRVDRVVSIEIQVSEEHVNFSYGVDKVVRYKGVIDVGPGGEKHTSPHAFVLLGCKTGEGMTFSFLRAVELHAWLGAHPETYQGTWHKVPPSKVRRDLKHWSGETLDAAVRSFCEEYLDA